jgi:outer membrane lipoprotein-sorting protein
VKIPAAILVLSLSALPLQAQINPAAGGRGSQVAPDAAIPLGTPTSATVAPEVMDLLKMLQDRKDSLKDFTAKIDYSVYHPATDETSGKRGTVDFLVDPNKGPVFTADFTADTDEDGKPKRAHHQQVIFDGQNVTVKDFAVKQFTVINVLPPGGKPGDAITLNGPMTLPIGIRVEDVLANFNVTLATPTPENPAPKSPDQKVLRFIPKSATRFDNFRQLEITVDKKLQLPVRLVQTAKNKDVTTITLSDIEPNTARARMQDPNPPANEGWTQRDAQQPGDNK